MSTYNDHAEPTRRGFQATHANIEERPLKSGISRPAKILSANPGALHRFETPSQVEPISSYELQTRIAYEVKHVQCDVEDPPAWTDYPVDGGILNRYTGFGDPEDSIDEDEHDFRCMLSAGTLPGMQFEGDGDDPPSYDEPRSQAGRYAHRSAGCSGELPTDYDVEDYDGGTSMGPGDEQLDPRDDDCGTIDRPISGGLWFEELVAGA